MISRMRTAFIAAGLLISLACSSQAQQQAGQDAAARIGDRTVTVRELDDRWKQEDPAAKAQADQAIYDGRKAALDAIIADSLIAQAAKAKGVTSEAFVKDEVAKRVKPVDDTDVRSFYVQNSERMQGRSFEQMSAAIQQYLEQQHQTEAKQDPGAQDRRDGLHGNAMQRVAQRHPHRAPPRIPAQGRHHRSRRERGEDQQRVDPAQRCGTRCSQRAADPSARCSRCTRRHSAPTSTKVRIVPVSGRK